MPTSLPTAAVLRACVFALLVFRTVSATNSTNTCISSPWPTKTLSPLGSCSFGNLTLDQLRSSPAFDPSPHNYSTVSITNPNFNYTYNLTYWVNSHGNVIHSGDIIWGTEDHLLSVVRGEQPRKRGYGVIGNDQSRWPGGIIKYRYSSQAVRDAHKDGFDSAINDWRSWAPYLQFVEYPIKDALEPDVVTITEDGGGCYATIGYYNDHKNLNVVPWNVRDPLYTYACYRHEFGHILGLLHEHQRPDRDKYIRYNCDAVQAVAPPGETCTEEEMDCCARPDSKCCKGPVSQLDKTPEEEPLVRTYGEYDVNSIMHYGGTAGAKGSSAFDMQLTLEPIWVPKYLPDFYNWFVGQVFRGLYYINPNYWIKASDAAAVCSIYYDLCKTYFPDGLPGEPVEPPPQTAIPFTSLPVTSVDPSTTMPISPSSTTSFPIPTVTLVEKSGWKFTFGSSDQVNAWTQDTSLFVPLVAGGQLSVNTRCIQVKEITGDGGANAILTGTPVVWETRLDPIVEFMQADTCCLRLSSGTSCGTSGGDLFLENCVGINGGSPVAAKSFQIYGCTGLYVPENY